MKNKIEKKVYENGTYVGELLANDRFGNGTMYYNNGRVYEGEWFMDQKSGKGTYTWPNGDKYVGEFLDNQRSGEGIYYFGEGKWKGDRYEGEFLNNFKWGFGIYYKADGKITYGKWEEGKLIKEYEDEEAYKNAINPPIIPIFDKKIPTFAKSFYIQEINYSGGSKYFGEVNKDIKADGFGLLIWDDHSCYVGQFENGQLGGYGVMFYEHGVVHMGKFKDGNFMGHACYIDEDFATFGFYDHFDQTKEYGWTKKINLKFNEEQLVYKHINDELTDYFGEVKNDKYHGLGILNKALLSISIGQFNEGIMEGIGIKIINNAEVYIGEFKNNEYNGYGMYITFDGKVKFGRWENNVFVGRN